MKVLVAMVGFVLFVNWMWSVSPPIAGMIVFVGTVYAINDSFG